MKVINVVGTRPNFIKIAPIVEEMKKHKEIEQILVHTGQHYDESMSKMFFDELEIPKPDINLEIGGGSNEVQQIKIKKALKKVLEDEKPDLVLVVGDVNSTLAAAQAAKSMDIKVAHVEAGLRSFDKTMPEEVNRIETDKISDFLFTTEKSGNENLLNEGILGEVHFVGNVMIDTLLKHKEKASDLNILEKLGVDKKDYCVLTLHRPSNVDEKLNFDKVLLILEKIQEKMKIVFPIHPRTNKNIDQFNLRERIEDMKNLMLVGPMGYLEFLSLMANSKLVLSDSGGIQEETTVLGVPCITLRNNTERPVTLEEGTNLLVSTDEKEVINCALEVISQNSKSEVKQPELWDGKAAKRIIEVLIKKFK